MSEMIAFDGADIRLVLSGHDSDICLLTYTPRPFHRDRLQQGFAKKFADRRGISGAYLISKRAHWWQSPELAQVEARVRDWAVFRAAKHRLAYGGSMGGFGVLLSAARTGCERALVSSPQTTFDPDYLTYPNRYAKDIEGLVFTEPHAWSGVRDGCEYLVVYDPLDGFDRRQVALLEPFANIAYLPVALASHSPLKLLQEAGVLEATILDLAHGRFDLAAARQRLRRGKRRCSLYYATLAAKAKETNRMTLALWSAQQAFILEPGSLLVYRTLAKLLRDQHDYDELARVSQVFMEAGGDMAAGNDQLRTSLFAARDFAAALALAEEMAAGPKATIEDRRWVAQILQAMGRRDEAMVAARALAADATAGVEDNLRLARLLSQWGHADESLDILNVAKARFPREAAIDVAHFDLLFGRRDYDAAHALASDILRRQDLPAAERRRIHDLINNPRLLSVRRRRNEQSRARLFQARAFDEALAIARQLAAEPDAGEADSAWVATILHRLGRFDEGVAIARSALDTWPGDPRLMQALFENLYSLNRYAEALVVGEKILADPETRDADRQRVERLARNPRLVAAIEREHVNQRRACMAARDFAGALEPARALAARDAATLEDRIFLIRILQQLRRHDEAAGVARAALDSYPANLRLMTSLFDNLFAGRELAQAKGVLLFVLAHPELAPEERTRLEAVLTGPRLADVEPAS